MRIAPALLVALVMPLAAIAADPKPGDMVNNPPFAHWSMFDPGTSVTQKETVTLSDGSKMEISKSFKLVEKSKDKVVVETTLTAAGNAGAQSTVSMATYPAKVKMSDVDTPSDMVTVTEGKESVDVKGKKIDAEWYEATTKVGDEVTTDKVWTAKEIPGGIIKETITRKKGGKVMSESLLEAVEWK